MESLLELPLSISLIFTLLLLLLPMLVVFIYFTHSHRPVTKTPPSPCCYPLIGNVVPLILNVHRFHDWITDMLTQTPSNTLIAYGLFNTCTGICTANPLNIEHLLRSNFSNYIKGSRVHQFLHELLGDGIFIVDSDVWLSQRKIASFEFNTRSLRSFIDETVQFQISCRLLPILSNAFENCKTIDLQDVLRRFAFDNICKLAFGDDPEFLSLKTNSISSSSSFVNAFDEAVEICFSRCMSPIHLIWKMKRFFNVGSEKKLKQAVSLIDNYAIKIIKSREENSSSNAAATLDRQDLLSRFMMATDDDDDDDKSKPPRDRKFLRDIIVSFILAGKDTTSTALTWFFWVLSANLDCQNRIYSELPQTGSGVYSYEDLKQLNYLHAAISESLRLFPPVPINTRLTVNDDVLPDGTKVKAGWFADYSAYAIGRMESVWGADCRVFRPERWLDKEGVFQPMDQYRFPVFHAGPRVCLGKEMAYMQMKCIAASVIHEFQVEAVDGGGDVDKMKNPPYALSVNLKMKGGLPVRLKKRRS